MSTHAPEFYKAVVLHGPLSCHDMNCIMLLYYRIDALKRSKSALEFPTYETYLKIFLGNHKAKGAMNCAKKIVMLLGATGT